MKALDLIRQLQHADYDVQIAVKFDNDGKVVFTDDIEEVFVSTVDGENAYVIQPKNA